MILKKLKNINSIEQKKIILFDAIKKCPDFYLYYQKMGDLSKDENNPVKAKEYYSKAISLNEGIRKFYEKGDLFQHHSNQNINFCGKYDRYPDTTGQRQHEGGLRISAKKKEYNPNLPIITIVTAVYNNENTFQRCIDSVKNQTYPNIEYIVIDGGSAPKTIDIINKNADFIDYFISEPDQGIYNAMNKGIELAKGQYISLLNSDDFYNIDFVKETVNNIESGVDIIYTDYYAGQTYLKAQRINDGILLGHLNICHNTFLVTKDCYNKIGKYDENFKIVSDATWMRKAYLEQCKFQVLNKNLFTLSDGGLSSGQDEKNRRLFINEVIKSYINQFPDLTENEAEEIYLFRFNKKRIDSVLKIAKKYRANYNFLSSLKNYSEFCFRERKNFELHHTETVLFTQYCNLLDLIDGDYKSIKINTKHGLFENVLSNLDKAIALKKQNPKKTILHFLSVFSTPSETFIYDLLLNLENNTNFDNFVLFEYKKLEQERPYCKALYVPWADFKEEVARAIYKYLIMEIKPDLVIGHFALNEWKFSQRIKPLNIKIPTISMTHGIDVFILKDKDKEEYRKYILNDFIKRSNTAFTTVSNYLYNELISQNVPKEKITLIHNTVDKIFFETRRQSKFYTGNRTLQILCVGRLIDWKGHKYLLLALKKLKEESFDFHLTLVYGNGKDILEEIEELINDSFLTKNVSLIPFVNFKEFPDYYSKFDCFVHPSTYSDDQFRKSETFGVAVLEAISAGLPVITTDAGGLPEVVGEHSDFVEIVKHANSDAIYYALKKFIANYKNTFKDNLTYAKTRLDLFSSEKQIQNLSDLILKVAMTKQLRVALLSSSTIQGAGYAAYRLHKGLSLLPNDTIKSHIFTTVRNHENEKNVHIIKHPTGNGKNWSFMQFQPKSGYTIFTVNQQSISSKKLVEMLQDYDVINLHWHARFISIENLATLTHSGKPIVLTIRDMHPLTGGCHYFHGCQEWKHACENCPQIFDSCHNYASTALKLKQKYYNFANITIVVLSEHTREIVKKVPFFNNCRIEKISNSIETDIFQPYEKEEVRKYFKLPKDKLIIGYVPSFSSDVKGYKEIIEVFKKLQKNAISKNIVVLLIGNETPATQEIQLEKINLGYISDNQKLAQAYSAADVIVVPSLEETFSNTTAEAISCGTPVVGFKTGAIPELVIDGQTGYTYEIGDIQGMTDGIIKVLSQLNFSENCREHAIKNYSFMIQAEKYKNLFSDLISNRNDHQNNLFTDKKIFEFFPEIGTEQLKICIETKSKT